MLLVRQFKVNPLFLLKQTWVLSDQIHYTFQSYFSAWLHPKFPSIYFYYFYCSGLVSSCLAKLFERVLYKKRNTFFVCFLFLINNCFIHIIWLSNLLWLAALFGVFRWTVCFAVQSESLWTPIVFTHKLHFSNPATHERLFWLFSDVLCVYSVTKSITRLRQSKI